MDRINIYIEQEVKNGSYLWSFDCTIKKPEKKIPNFPVFSLRTLILYAAYISISIIIYYLSKNIFFVSDVKNCARSSTHHIYLIFLPSFATFAIFCFFFFFFYPYTTTTLIQSSVE